MPRAMPDGPGKRHTLSSRLTPEVHTALREAAKLAGRSVSQEAEFRIERSFIEDGKSQDELKSNLVAKALLGDDLSAELVRSFITAIGAAMGYTGRHWRDDVYTRASVKSAIDAVRDRHFLANPLGVDPSAIDIERLERAAKTGSMLGKILVAAHLDPDVASWIEDMAKAEKPVADADVDASEFSKLTPERQRAALNKMTGIDAK